MREKTRLNSVKLLALLGLAAPLLQFSPPLNRPYSRAPYQLRTLVIDAGHGGKDPGALGRGGTREKDVVLNIALELGARIREAYPGVKVIFTRKNDTFVELAERSAIANRNRAQLFISIHANALARPEYFGTETYVMGLHVSGRNLAVARRENAVIEKEANYKERYDGLDPASPLTAIMLENYQSAYLSSSLNFASKVESHFKRAARTSHGVKQAGFIVLWQSAMPSVLVETGYLTNASEERFLRSAAGQEKLAVAIFNAFEQYKKEVEE